ncbi:MAG: FixH family protein [Armatimonadota bacterium]|nr:FixH family protein [Armatimonadota bacterium]MDR7427690.1 FixH family protein [Armatimonadota bacterium]MDR7463994.1 FixH family protein [Armatimonadota bacterium]MDR7470283.1 FixH family protein [Armatimonadota bacterium]MDR7475382.1 FixH family protein [Armatimonadota bacterium]
MTAKRLRPTVLPILVALPAVALLSLACAPRAQSTVGEADWQAYLSATPQRPAALRPVILQLRLTDRQGAPLDVADLEGYAGMPEMEHGESRITFRRTAPGVYVAEHTFSMDGRWVIRLQGRRNGAPFAGRVAVEVGR